MKVYEWLLNGRGKGPDLKVTIKAGSLKEAITRGKEYVENTLASKLELCQEKLNCSEQIIDNTNKKKGKPMFDPLKVRLNEMRAHAQGVINNPKKSLDQIERAYGLLSGCCRISKDIENYEKGDLTLKYINKRIDQTMYELHNPYREDLSVKNYIAGLKNSWLELKTYLEDINKRDL